MLARAFDRGADQVILDLEDAVPSDRKDHAREIARAALQRQTAWVRINRPGTDDGEADLTALASFAYGVRLPKVSVRDDVEWTRKRAPASKLGCTIETALGVMNSLEIASAPDVHHLAFGAADLASELSVTASSPTLRQARATIVLAARAAGLEHVIDGAHTDLKNLELFRVECAQARSTGFTGKSAIHPSQVAVINDVFAPTDHDRSWAQDVIAAFEAAAGNPVQLATGEFVDAAVVRRARRITETP